MQKISADIVKRCKELLADGTVARVIGWEPGEFFYDHTPAVFESADEMDGFVYDVFCGANLSKYLILKSKGEGKTLVLLKPCDCYSFNQLLTEHRINRENIYVIGVGCDGMVDIDKIRDKGIKGIESVEEKDGVLTVHTIYGDKTVNKEEVLIERCYACKGRKHVAYDELISPNEDEQLPDYDRFSKVKELEAMTPEERFEFWRSQLSKCIRCNACRNVCPACNCLKCVFDNARSGVASKASPDTFEENMFHIIRAFHVAGRCTDCGECSRVCPQHIPLHLLNRKFIKDIDEFYGDYQAGLEPDQRGPLVNYATDDIEPTTVSDGGRK